jgi:hypothetical protein
MPAAKQGNRAGKRAMRFTGKLLAGGPGGFRARAR